MATQSAAGPEEPSISRRKRVRTRADKEPRVTCQFWLWQKRRYCRHEQLPGGTLCGLHAALPAEVLARGAPPTEAQSALASAGAQGSAYAASVAKGRRQVSCPVDPSHTVSEGRLSRHVKRCRELMEGKQGRTDAWFCQDCNACPSGGAPEPPPPEAAAVADAATLRRFYARIRGLLAAHVGAIPSVAADASPEADRIVAAATAAGMVRGLRHAHQHGAIATRMRTRGLLGEPCTFVEFGAGKGMLAGALALSLAQPRLLLIDREGGMQGKADKELRKNAAVTLRRIRIDIRHLLLAKAPLVEGPRASCPVVAVSKHLCGVATDLTLNCLLAADPTGSGAVRGAAIALCCHHRCAWSDYCGRQWFTAQGLTADDFALARRLSAWAVCFPGRSKVAGPDYGGRGDQAEEGAPGELSAAEKVALGRDCKRLIDAGRMHFLRQRGFCAELVHYADPGTTPENALLVAWREAPGS